MRVVVMVGCAAMALTVGVAACGGDGGGSGGGSGGSSGTTTTTTTTSGSTTTTTTTTTTTSTGSNACDGVAAGFKAKLTELSCPNDESAKKQQDCEDVVKYFPACATQLDTAMKCIFALPTSEWMCDPNGMSSPKQGTCQTEIDAVSNCVSPPKDGGP